MSIRLREKRLVALEQKSSANPIVVILNREGLDRDTAVARWEADHGSLADSYLLLVNVVDAAL